MIPIKLLYITKLLTYTFEIFKFWKAVFMFLKPLKTCINILTTFINSEHISYSKKEDADEAFVALFYPGKVVLDLTSPLIASNSNIAWVAYDLPIPYYISCQK